MMYQTLLDAQYEAERFLRIVEAAKACKGGRPDVFVTSNPKISGALRRSSMDLTRKLADLRQNR